MNKLILVLITSFTLQFGYSQNVIYRGEKSYPSTNGWSLKLADEYSEIQISVAKISKISGYIMLKTSVPFNFMRFTSNFMIYLENGSVLTIKTKVANDNVDDNAIALFTINSNQIEKLKASDIIKIRFSIYHNGFPDTIESKTATNKLVSSSTSDLNLLFQTEKSLLYQTAKEISELFEN